MRLDLQTRDAFDAAIFYAEVFDWARPPGGCTVDYAQDHIIVQAAGRTVATLYGGGDETGPDHGSGHRGTSTRPTRAYRSAFSRAAPMGAAAPARVRDREHPGHPGGVAQVVVWATRAAAEDPAARAAPLASEAPPAPADPEAMGVQAAAGQM
ncbi:hypothetical protein [Streptomyces sp. NPDC018352]|uniref:hypothetical protein n=1 Tax=Streptomyces sp. NPDC018352 TaxID=3157194 RepID=UPI0033E9741D